MKFGEVKDDRDQEALCIIYGNEEKISNDFYDIIEGCFQSPDEIISLLGPRSDDFILARVVKRGRP